MRIAALVICVLAGLVAAHVIPNLTTLEALIRGYDARRVAFYDYDPSAAALALNRAAAFGMFALGVLLLTSPMGLRGVPWRLAGLVLVIGLPLALLASRQQGELLTLGLAGATLLFAVGELWGLVRWLGGVYLALFAMLLVGQGGWTGWWMGMFYWMGGYNAGSALYYSLASMLSILAMLLGAAALGGVVGLFAANLPALWSLRWRFPLLPHNRFPPDHHLLRHELRRLRHGRDAAGLRQKTRRWLGWGFWLPFGLGLFGLALVVASPPVMSSSSFTRPLSMYDSVGNFLMILFLLSVADRLLLDFIAVSASATTISDDVRTGHWELLCLSDVSADTVLHAKHTLAQVRTWRMMAVMTGLRAAVVALGALFLFVLPYLLPESSSISRPFGRILTFEDMWQAAVAIICLAILAAIYLFEGCWRVRALAAGSVLISSKLRPTSDAILNGAGTVFTLWLVQGLGLLACWLTAGLLFTALPLLITPGIGENESYGLLLLLTLGTAALVYVVYNRLTWRWLWMARARLVKAGAAA